MVRGGASPPRKTTLFSIFLLAVGVLIWRARVANRIEGDLPMADDSQPEVIQRAEILKALSEANQRSETVQSLLDSRKSESVRRSRKPRFTVAHVGYIAGGLVLMLMTIFVPDRVPELKFYELTALIVPVLFLALVVETGAFRTNAHYLSSGALAAGAISFLLAFAGYVSLRAIAEGDTNPLEYRLVCSALVAATVSLYLQAAVLQQKRPT
jgi:hypothetical protein